MTFTASTVKELRALNLDAETIDKILEIFERARVAKSAKKGGAADRTARGTRLEPDWVLPDEWLRWSTAIGMREGEVRQEARKFKNWALNAPGQKGVKLRWDLTWQNWCYKFMQDAGRAVLAPAEGDGAASRSGSQSGPEAFTAATWKAIATRYKAGTPWNPAWGPAPGRMDCMMPVELL